MIGRRVQAFWGEVGTVVRWEPLSAAMHDTLVRYDYGEECWYASHTLKPIDGQGPLPSRQEAQEKARQESLTSLRKIRQQLVDEIKDGKPWPGIEFGKGHLGQAIDSAIKELEKK